MNFHQSKIGAMLLVGGVLISMVGCGKSGPKRVAVQGEIKVKGTFLKDGRITFIPTEETRGPAAVATVREGKFELTSRTGPVAGKNKVQIEAIVNPGFALDDEKAYANAAETKQDNSPVIPNQPILPEYNERTELFVDLSGNGSTNFAFEVEAYPNSLDGTTHN